jgi:hypothetical protein
MPAENEGIMDKVKDAAGKVTDKVGERFSEHIDKVQDATDRATDKLAGEDDKGGGAAK